MDEHDRDRRYSAAALVWGDSPDRFGVEAIADLPTGDARDIAAGEVRSAALLVAERARSAA